MGAISMIYRDELLGESFAGNAFVCEPVHNLVHRLVIMADDTTIDTPDLPENFRFSAKRSKGLHRTLAEIEHEHILDVLSANKNNISHAAQILGIDRKTLREKIKKHSN